MFYVYLHKKPNGQIFYVGKGKGYRATQKSNRNAYWKRVVDKYGYNVTIFKDNMTEQEAFNLEMELIEAIGLENLTNLTVGGDGTSGFTHKAETKRKIGLANSGGSSWSKGKRLSENHKKGIGEGNSKKVHQFTCDDKFVAEYNSASEAVKKTGIKGVYRVCLGIDELAKGYKFKYINNN
jgi:hypothetical protein